ncbi:MAG: hypothetical protein ABUL67_02080 [Haliangium ochraceum]
MPTQQRARMIHVGASVGWRSLLSSVTLLGIGACYPNPDDLRSGGGPTASGGSTGAGTGGVDASGGAPAASGGASSGGRAGTGGAVGTGGRSNSTGGAGAGGASGMCSNPMFPLACPAMNGVPATCWEAATDCASLKNCDGTYHACRATNPNYVCSVAACASDAIVNGARVYCDAMNRCAPQFLIRVYGTPAACYAAQQGIWTLLGSPPDTTWNAAAFNACSSALAALSCTDYFDHWPTACAPPGKRANGSACASSDQCSSVRCILAAGPTCGQCAAQALAGGACRSDSDCGAGLICAAAGSCVAPQGLQAACNRMTAPCLYSLSCRAGVCAMPGRAGANCVAHEDCDVTAGWWCNFTTYKCGAATGGATCGSNADGTTRYCGALGVCNENGTCLAAAKEGQSCNNTTGPSCAVPGRCVAGACAVTKFPVQDCAVATMSTLAFDPGAAAPVFGAAALRPSLRSALPADRRGYAP